MQVYRENVIGRDNTKDREVNGVGSAAFEWRLVTWFFFGNLLPFKYNLQSDFNSCNEIQKEENVMSVLTVDLLKEEKELESNVDITFRV